MTTKPENEQDMIWIANGINHEREFSYVKDSYWDVPFRSKKEI